MTTKLFTPEFFGGNDAFIAAQNWNKGDGLLPAIVQNATDDEVLMLGYMNEDSLRITLDEDIVCFWSRSRQELWRKGQTSGNVLRLGQIATDCDRDTLLVRAYPAGPTCHRDATTCFDADGNDPKSPRDITFRQKLNAIELTMDERARQAANDPDADSYTIRMFRDPNKIVKKLGEEFMELIDAVDRRSPKDAANEGADFINALRGYLRVRGQNVSVLEMLDEDIKRNGRTTLNLAAKENKRQGKKDYSNGNAA